MRSGVPSPYTGSQNPYSQTPEAIRAGGSLYQQQCAVCHGVQGVGDGVAANSLTPPPAVLDQLIQVPMAADEYLLWSISEGGKPFGTDMPAFKEQLSENDIWKIVAYMRAGFPSTTDSDPQ
ncbi:c-type cytochrome [Aestuariirhabdus sp. LZHN29]|uniref:c-type cytochrome n=1 Tax=Aestuariirhabdus sp. LZHN29 TaxID=3417462 RepID=UPI003CE74726